MTVEWDAMACCTELFFVSECSSFPRAWLVFLCSDFFVYVVCACVLTSFSFHSLVCLM